MHAAIDLDLLAELVIETGIDEGVGGEGDGSHDERLVDSFPSKDRLTVQRERDVLQRIGNVYGARILGASGFLRPCWGAGVNISIRYASGEPILEIDVSGQFHTLADTDASVVDYGCATGRDNILKRLIEIRGVNYNDAVKEALLDTHIPTKARFRQQVGV
ncbi:hypothetical protein D9M68_868380 [compost metagenome]